MDKLPAVLAKVVEPLREADEYRRLQEVRQRGFYTLVTGLPMLLLFMTPVFRLMIPLDDDIGSGNPGINGWRFALHVLALGFLPYLPFTLSCFPRLFLPIVRRVRPDWQSPLIEANLLKNALEKHFWFQLPCALSYILAIALAILSTVLFPQVKMWQAALAYGGVVHLVVMPILARHAARGGDPGLATVYRRLTWLALAAFVLSPFADWEPAGAINLPSPMARLALATLGATVVLPSIFLGLYRLLAPRRWLVP